MTAVCVWWGPVWDLACVTQIGRCVLSQIRHRVWWLEIIKDKSGVDGVSSSGSLILSGPFRKEMDRRNC